VQVGNIDSLSEGTKIPVSLNWSQVTVDSLLRGMLFKTRTLTITQVYAALVQLPRILGKYSYDTVFRIKVIVGVNAVTFLRWSELLPTVEPEGS